MMNDAVTEPLSMKNYIVCFGETLWDLFPTGKVAGGAPMNVAVGLHHRKLSAYMISKVGADALGNELMEFLNNINFPTHWIQTDTTYQTGVVDVAANEFGENTYTIVQPVAWDFIETTPTLENLVANSFAFVYGSLVCRNEVSRQSLIALAQKATLRVFDVNFRSPFFSQSLIETLMAEADIVKMNEDELRIMAGWYGLSNILTEQALMQYFKEQFTLQAFVLTRGVNGAALLNGEGYFESEGFVVKVQDTVGSGDAFLTGYLKCLYEGKTPAFSLRYACALGALVATHKGATPIIAEEEIKNKYEL
jgi:fructokinase